MTQGPAQVALPVSGEGHPKEAGRQGVLWWGHSTYTWRAPGCSSPLRTWIVQHAYMFVFTGLRHKIAKQNASKNPPH
jgi:hypothetical protein